MLRRMQRGGIHHWPFESKYLRDFEVLEERRDGLRLFPRTEQLPLLAKAIDAEFHAGLTTRLANTDERGDPWRKMQLREAALAYCTVVNAARSDHLHVHPFYTLAGVTQIALVQHITESTAGGTRHWFRQFRGTDFLPEIFLSGKRIVFSGHAIERYAQRALAEFGHTVIHMMKQFWNSPPLILQLDGHSSAFVYWAGNKSLAIQPFEETATEFFILTTLNPHQTKSLTVPQPLRRVYLHYGEIPPRPGDNGAKFSLEGHAANLVEIWKTHPEHTGPSLEEPQFGSWTRVVQRSKRVLREEGHNENSGFVFYDHIYGPSILTYDFIPDPPPSLRLSS